MRLIASRPGKSDDAVNSGKFTSFESLTGGPGVLKWPAAHVLAADCAAIAQIEGTNYNLKEPFACYNSLLIF